MPVPARIIPTAPARQENSLLAAANLVLGLLIAGCGSDGRAPAAPTQVATPPTPAPPVPPPVVTPPDPAPVPTGPLIAEVAPGGRLEGAHVCAGTRDTFAEGRLVGIEMLGPAILAELASPAFAIDYVNDNSFGTDFNGFGGSSYAPGDRRTAPSRAYAGYVLARVGRAPLGTLRSLYDSRRKDAKSGLSLVHLGLALSLQGDKKRGEQAIAQGFALTRPPNNDVQSDSWRAKTSRATSATASAELSMPKSTDGPLLANTKTRTRSSCIRLRAPGGRIGS